MNTDVAKRLTVTPMSGRFGAYVDGIDLRTAASEEEMRLLTQALWDHRVLEIRGQQRLTEAAYARFGRMWGDPIAFFVPSARHQDFPEIIRIRNSPSTPEQSRDGAMHWHSDSSYEHVPATVTMLYGVEVPAEGNSTMFIDAVAVYEALDPAMRDRVRDLVVVHDPAGGKVFLPGEVRGRGAHTALPTVTHPLVARHPVVGRSALYGFSGTACGIVGMPEPAALELLLALKRFAVRDEFRSEARCDAGSILVWDNWSVLHSATRTTYSNEEGERRVLHRISTRGLPAVSTARG